MSWTINARDINFYAIHAACWLLVAENCSRRRLLGNRQLFIMQNMQLKVTEAASTMWWEVELKRSGSQVPTSGEPNSSQNTFALRSRAEDLLTDLEIAGEKLAAARMSQVVDALGRS